MRVATVGRAFHGYFSKHFDSCEIINGPSDIARDWDLVILTGGEDINPRHYNQSPRGAVMWSDSRDLLELDVMRYMSRFCNTYVLGVCRGHQLINVSLGGNLIQDMHTEGIKHSGPRHKLDWYGESELEPLFPETNSIHHQAIKTIGTNKGKFPYTVLARESQSQVIEAVLWSDFYLGVQFHPEFMAESSKFFTLIKEWVDGKPIIKLPDDQQESLKQKRLKKIKFIESRRINEPPEEPRERYANIFPDTNFTTTYRVTTATNNVAEQGDTATGYEALPDIRWSEVGDMPDTDDEQEEEE